MEIALAEAAERLGVSDRRARQLVASGKLAARKVAGRLLVDESSIARSRSLSRPMSRRMSWALIDLLSGRRPAVSPAELVRLRKMAVRLQDASNPADLLRSWLPARAARDGWSVAPDDLRALASDRRLALSGISDARSGLSSGSELEAYVQARDVDGLVREHLLSSVGPWNVIFHVLSDEGLPEIKLGLLLADLADRDGVREDAQVKRLLRRPL